MKENSQNFFNRDTFTTIYFDDIFFKKKSLRPLYR